MSILIIGTGFSGLCMAIRLKRAGIHSFTILERGDDVGGTWRDNNYPGCACDVQSHLYSFSFEANPDWTRMFAPQPEIQRYLRRCADKYGVRGHVKFRENVVRAEYDESASEWVVTTDSGNQYRAAVLVAGLGFLSNPAYPDLPGLDRFRGTTFHSAAWNHEYDLRGKRVAVIGTGASAIQFVPQIVPKVAHLELFQRTPPWIISKPDRPISDFERAIFRALPFTQKLRRNAIYWLLEMRVLGLVVHPKVMKYVQRAALELIEKQVPDPALRRKVTPGYTIGCKRILLSNDWYPAISRPNVEVVTQRVQAATERGVLTADGREHEVDAIIFGTGFKVQNPFPRGAFAGLGGRDIWDAWQNGAEAYKGTSVAGFPNLFFVIGPNTGLGHSSMVYMIEAQVTYILDAIRQMRAGGWRSMDVRPEVQASYNDALQEKHKQAVWTSGCKSWYVNENGKNTAVWPDFTFRFRKQTARFGAGDYAILPGKESRVS